MSIFIFESDAFDKICRVEGERYAEQQKNFDTCSFSVFKEKWEELIAGDPTLKEEEDMHFSVDGNYAIYGKGGYNRYIVYFSGEIVFLDAAAADQSEDIERAREIGFRIQ